MTLLLPLSLITILTSSISGIIGMGGGVLLLSLMTFFLPYNLIIPIHGVTQLVSNSSRAFFLKGHVNKLWSLYYVIGASIGVLVTVLLLKKIDLGDYPKILISLLIFYVIFKPKKLPELVIPDVLWIVVGFFSGILSLLVGATGPFLASFFVRSDLNKEGIVATKAFMQLFSHLLKIPAFMYLSFPYLDYMTLMIAMSICALIGTRIGVTGLKKIDQKLFTRIFKVVLFGSAVRILYTVFYP
jgi:uncharacterized membrane protein YfcA